MYVNKNIFNSIIIYRIENRIELKYNFEIINICFVLQNICLEHCFTYKVLVKMSLIIVINTRK